MEVVNLLRWNRTLLIANETVTKLKYGAWKKELRLMTHELWLYSLFAFRLQS